MIKKFATSEGGERFKARFPGAVFRSLNGQQLSSIGWSTSRKDGAESAQAIEFAAKRGANVFDLVPYDREGDVELAMAGALRGSLARDEVVLMVHAGILPDAVLRFGPHVAAITEKYVKPGVFEWAELALGSHCIAPRYLRQALAASVGRLDTNIDIALVTSPAAQLIIASPATVERRVARAFEALEECVEDGVIACYGITEPGELQLEKMMQIATDIAGANHHFRAVHFSLSLARAERVLATTQSVNGHWCSVLTAARDLGLYVFASGVIDAAEAEYDLPPDVHVQLGRLFSDAQVGLQWARSLPGVGTALCGMRRAMHIEENMHVVNIPPADSEIAAAFLPEEQR